MASPGYVDLGFGTNDHEMQVGDFTGSRFEGVHDLRNILAYGFLEIAQSVNVFIHTWTLWTLSSYPMFCLFLYSEEMHLLLCFLLLGI